MRKVLAYSFAALFLLFFADWIVASIQSNSFDERVGGSDILERLSSRVVRGATRREVEKVLAGFREVEVRPRAEGYLVGYGYWFGFLPPLGGKSGLKYVGEVTVIYSPDGRAVKSSYWYN